MSDPISAFLEYHREQVGGSRPDWRKEVLTSSEIQRFSQLGEDISPYPYLRRCNSVFIL